MCFNVSYMSVCTHQTPYVFSYDFPIYSLGHVTLFFSFFLKCFFSYSCTTATVPSPRPLSPAPARPPPPQPALVPQAATTPASPASIAISMSVLNSAAPPPAPVSPHGAPPPVPSRANQPAIQSQIPAGNTLTHQAVSASVLAAPPCVFCMQPLTTSAYVFVEGRGLHRECARCVECGGNAGTNNSRFLGDRLMCGPCGLNAIARLGMSVFFFYA